MVPYESIGSIRVPTPKGHGSSGILGFFIIIGTKSYFSQQNVLLEEPKS